MRENTRYGIDQTFSKMFGHVERMSEEGLTEKNIRIGYAGQKD